MNCASKFSRHLSVSSVGVLAAFVGLAATLAVTPPAFAQAAPAPVVVPDRVQLEKRLESVRTLLEKSSAARQIEASGDPKALAERARALALLVKAKEALDKGELAAAQQFLLDAPKIMFAAAKLAAPEQIVAEKSKADYTNRRESVKALLAAQKRINEEKGGKVQGVAEATRDIEKMLDEGDQLAAAGKYIQGKAVVDRAYLLAKATVGGMRSGDTLVRSLNFANKEEEFKYEIDRNDTHLSLIKVLIEQQGKVLPAFATVFLEKAAKLRAEAEAVAQKGDHAEGVKLLEESTSNLAKAIRAGGIFIPG